MNKTPKMLKVEQKFGIGLEELLKQKYEVEKKTAVEIGESVGVESSTVCRWLHEYEIHVRSNSEAQLGGKMKPDEAQLRQWYEVERKSAVEIAELVGAGDTTVGRWLREYKIHVRSAAESNFGPSKNPGEKQLRQWYEVEKKSIYEIAKRVHVSNSAVGLWLHDYNIPVRSISEARLNGKTKPDEEQLRQWCEIDKKSVLEIAELMGVSNTTVCRLLRYYSISIKATKNPGKEQLRQWYEIDKKSTLEIAELIGVSGVTVGCWLRDYKIPIRSNSEARLNGKTKPGEEQLRQWYEIEKKSTGKIANLIGVSDVTVGNWLREYNIPLRSAAESNFGPSKNPGEKQLKQWYEVEKKSSSEIAELIGVSSFAVCDWLRNYKIPIRNNDTNRYLKAKALEEVVRRIVE
jgi:transposase